MGRKNRLVLLCKARQQPTVAKRRDLPGISMSLIISVYTREGVVMAADSRLTLTIPGGLLGDPAQALSLTTSDSAKKLFLGSEQHWHRNLRSRGHWRCSHRRLCRGPSS